MMANMRLILMTSFTACLSLIILWKIIGIEKRARHFYVREFHAVGMQETKVIQSGEMFANTSRNGILHQRTGIYDIPEHVIWVNSDRTLLKKLSLFNDVIYRVSRNVLEVRGSGKWRPISPIKQTKLVIGTSSQYLKTLASIDAVTTVILGWSDASGTPSGGDKRRSQLDTSNLLITNSYPMTGSDKLCDKIRGKQPFTQHRYETVFNHQCSSNASGLFRVTSLQPYFLNALQVNEKYYWPNAGAAWPAHFYTELPRLVTYMHIIEDGIVNNNGEVFTGKYKIIPYNCKPVFNNKRPEAAIDSFPLFGEVFSVSQFWGENFFHKNLEDFPKISPYLEFLKRTPQVKVHLYETGAYTEFVLHELGVDRSRLISGVVRAHVVYLPRGTTCGFAQIPETQIFSHHLRSSLRQTKGEQQNLVLIQRSRNRFFLEKNKVAQILETVAKEFGLNFYIFKDNPLPPVEEVRKQFNRAAIVIGPHGAGLSNLLFCQPGTLVVEGLCNPPHTNMCYTRLAQLLGLRYYALLARGGCEGHVDIPPEEIEAIVRSLLKKSRTLGGT